MKTAIIAALIGLTGTTGALAQSTRGTVRGGVVDQSGTAVANVAIAIVHSDTGDRRDAATDAAGRFVVPVLAVGAYEVTATAAGFAARRQEGLRVRPGETTTLRLELVKAALPDTVTIAGLLPVLDAAQPHAGGVVETGELAFLFPSDTAM